MNDYIDQLTSMRMISRYREMVEAMIAELTAHNPILQKIKDGEEVSPDQRAVHGHPSAGHTQRVQSVGNQRNSQACRRVGGLMNMNRESNVCRIEGI